MLTRITAWGAALALGAWAACASPAAAAGNSVVPLPPAEGGARAALETSPRHHEWARIAVPGTDRQIQAFVAFPERKDKAPVVVVIHEVYGLTDWIRAVADRLAGEGFIAIAPDLLSGRGPGGKGTEGFAGRDEVVRAVRELEAEAVVTALDAVSGHARSLPAATGRVATVGFCWGGGMSFRYAAAQPELAAAVVYYGVSPAPEGLASVRARVLGLYGEDDARVNVTVGPAEARMKELGKPFSARFFAGAGHGFLRQQDGREGANLKAAQEAWPQTISFLKDTLEEPAGR